LKLDADLGNLRSGDQGVATVTIRNPLEHDIPITTARASCSCARSKLLATSIPSGGSAELVVALAVPTQSPNSDFVGTVSLSVDRAACQIPTLREVLVSVRYTITGMLSFVDRHSSIAVLPNEKRTVHVPFVATLPGVPDCLEIDATGFLRGVPGSLVERDEKWFVKFEVGSDDANSEGAFGQIKLSSKEHDVSDTIQLALYLESAAQISPRTLRFRPADGGLEATAILHFSGQEGADHKSDANLDSRERASLFCEAFISSRKLDVQVQPISGNVHRLKVVYDDSKESLQALTEKAKKANSISWTIITNKKRHSLQSAFALSP